MFITFEGIEGSGKSTQLQECELFLEEKKIDYISTKEPGGTKLGATIRQWLLDPETEFHHSYTEVLLFIADRLEHVETIIKPALLSKKVVLCDRFKDSTLAYQLAGRQLDPSLIHSLNALVQLDPDATLLFDCPIDIGLSRAKARAKLDRFEDEAYAFHQRIYDYYHTIAKQQPKRIHIIDANNTIESVKTQTLKVLLELINRR